MPSEPASTIKRKESLLIEAARERTRPLLLFGQPKDTACIELFRLFNEEDDDVNEKHTPASLRWEFELAAFDAEQSDVRQLADKLGIAIGKDRPAVLAMLNADGSLSTTFPLSLGAGKKLDAAALTAFLLKNKLPTRDAEQMLADALKRAKEEDKRVFFIASASWCGPCRRLGRFMDPFKTELNRHYVFVKLDVSRDEHAQTVTKRFQKDADGGVPWYAILDSEGKVLITSNMTDVKRRGKPANVGFPSGVQAVEHFMNMLSLTAPRLGDRQKIEIREALLKK